MAAKIQSTAEKVLAISGLVKDSSKVPDFQVAPPKTAEEFLNKGAKPNSDTFYRMAMKLGLLDNREQRNFNKFLEKNLDKIYRYFLDREADMEDLLTLSGSVVKYARDNTAPYHHHRWESNVHTLWVEKVLKELRSNGSILRKAGTFRSANQLYEYTGSSKDYVPSEAEVSEVESQLKTTRIIGHRKRPLKLGQIGESTIISFYDPDYPDFPRYYDVRVSLDKFLDAAKTLDGWLQDNASISLAERNADDLTLYKWVFKFYRSISALMHPTHELTPENQKLFQKLTWTMSDPHLYFQPSMRQFLFEKGLVDWVPSPPNHSSMNRNSSGEYTDTGFFNHRPYFRPTADNTGISIFGHLRLGYEFYPSTNEGVETYLRSILKGKFKIKNIVVREEGQFTADVYPK